MKKLLKERRLELCIILGLKAKMNQLVPITLYFYTTIRITLTHQFAESSENNFKILPRSPKQQRLILSESYFLFVIGDHDVTHVLQAILHNRRFKDTILL